jgi:integrase
MRGAFRRVGPNKYRHIVDLPRGLDGRRRQKTFTYIGDRRSAERQAAENVITIDRGEFVTEVATVSDLFERFLAVSQAKGTLAAKTLERYSEISETHIIPTLGEITLESLAPKNLEDAYSQWLRSGRRDGKAGGLSARTVLHFHRLLRRVLQQAVRWQMVIRNVADAVEPPRPGYSEMKVLSGGQLRALLDAARTPTPHCERAASLTCDSAFYPALVFLASTGARRGECLALRWSDLNLTAGTATIRRSLEQTRAGLNFKSPKSGRSRTLQLGAHTVEALRSLRAAQAKDRLFLGAAYSKEDLVFARRDGTPYSPHAFGEAFRALVRRAEVPVIRLHDLRHTHASLLGQANVSMKVISERLGHSGIGITADTYSHVFASQDGEAARLFDSVLDGTGKVGV